MSKVMLVIDEPKTCSECRFLSNQVYIRDYDCDGRLYRRVAKCEFAPRSIEDPWRETYWLCNNKEEWCPLKPVEED